VSTSSSLLITSELNVVFNKKGTLIIYRSQASLKDIAYIKAYIYILKGVKYNRILIKYNNKREEAFSQRRISISNI